VRLARHLTVPIRSTVRLRLTLLYGGLFFLAGALLLILTYTLVGHAQPAPDESQIQGFPGPPFESEPLAITLEERQANAQTIFDERERAREEWLRSIRTQSGIALLLTSAGAIALGWVVAGRVLRPVRQITLYARQLSSANLDQRIALSGPRDELRELADTIDAMLDRLQAAFQSQRRFSAQVSHELLTPLAIMRAEADVALANPEVTADEAEFAAKIRSAVERCEGIIDALLTMARSESTMRDHDLIDLSDVTGDVVSEYLDSASKARIRVEVALENAVVSGDRALLERLIGNLVDNAIRYNHRGGYVAITVVVAGTSVKLSIENSGSEIDHAEAETLLTPFQRGLRASSQTPGHGLGLAIAHAVTLAHGGILELRARDRGGLVIDVEFPLAVHEPPSAHKAPLVTKTEMLRGSG
jgi:signal transduction histidine kinase